MNVADRVNLKIKKTLTPATRGKTQRRSVIVAVVVPVIVVVMPEVFTRFQCGTHITFVHVQLHEHSRDVSALLC